MCRLNLISYRPELNLGNLVYAPLINISLLNAASNNRDGFGVFSGGHVWKHWKDAQGSVRTPELWTWLTSVKPGSTVFAHVRQATVNRSTLNASLSHPFVSGQFAGMHNGHFVNYAEVREKYKLADAQLDSHVFFEVLIKNLREMPQQEVLLTIQKTVDEFIGPFVFVFHDSASGGTWLILGQNRTLYRYANDDICFLNTDGSLLEEITLHYNEMCLMRPDLSAKPLTVQKLEQDTVYYLLNGQLSMVGHITSVPEIEKKSTTTTPMVGVGFNKIGDYTISSKFVIHSVDRRRKFLSRYHLDEASLDACFSSLYPLVQGDLFSLSERTLTLLDGFFQTLDPLIWTNIGLKTELWREITKDVVSDDPVRVCTELEPSFVTPYFINPVGLLESLRAKVK